MAQSTVIKRKSQPIGESESFKLPTKKPKRRIKPSTEKSLSSIIKLRQEKKNSISHDDLSRDGDILESKVLNSKSNR